MRKFLLFIFLFAFFAVFSYPARAQSLVQTRWMNFVPGSCTVDQNNQQKIYVYGGADRGEYECVPPGVYKRVPLFALSSLAAETSIASDDEIVIFDTSANDWRRMTRANFVAGLGGGGGGSWGTISGTLSSQSDLQSALDAKLGGTGSTNYFPFWSGSSALTNSAFQFGSGDFASTQATFYTTSYNNIYFWNENDVFGGSNYSTLLFGNGKNYSRLDFWQTQDATHGNNYEQFVYDGLGTNYAGFTMSAFISSDVYMWQWAKHRIINYTDNWQANNFAGNSEFTIDFVPNTATGRFRVGDFTTTPTNYLDLDQSANSFTINTTNFKLNIGSDATGDIFYRNSSGNVARLGVGANGQVLKLVSGLPSWQNESGGGGVAVGNVISGGTFHRVLYEDNLNQVAESVNLTFDGNTLIGANIFASTTFRAPVRATTDNCASREIMFNAGGRLYVCPTTDTWAEIPMASIAGSAGDELLGTNNTNTAWVTRSFTGSNGVSIAKSDSNFTFSADINSLTADATPDGANDYVMTYDASAATNKKVLLNNLPGGGGGQTSIQFKDEGSNLGTSGTVDSVDCVGSGITCSRTTNALTVTVSGGGTGVMAQMVFRPQQNEPPATIAATPDLRNNHPVLDFDGTADEEAVFSSQLPASYGGAGLTVTLTTLCTSATTGSFRFQVAFERMDSATDLDADSFASFQSGGGTCPATSGAPATVTINFSNGAQMDSLAAGEPFRLKVRRDADGTSGTDDVTTDVELRMISIKEQ